jgi:transposase
MDDSTTPTPADPRDAIIARQAATIKRLEAIIEELRRGGKRQAAPFSTGIPKRNPQKPGRKPGPGYGTPPSFRAMPESASTDQVFDVAPPDACPGCGDDSAPIVESIDEQVQRDIEVRTIVRRFKTKVCKCPRCGKRRRGRHPLQTSSATGCCASQIGPTARSVMAFMNKTLGLSIGKVADCFGTLWGLEVTRGGVCHAIAAVGEKCGDSYRSIVDSIQHAPQVTPDETGWRVGGFGAWLHAAATQDARVYVIDPARGKDATEKLITDNYSGVMVHDGWSPYDRYFDAKHQQCLAHLLRRCNEMIEVARPGSAVFPKKIKAILKGALALRDQRANGRRSLRSTRIHATKLTRRIRTLCKTTKSNPANDRLAGFLYRHADALFTFLKREGIDATNWRGEQAIRGAVVNRKVWGGNRTWRGAHTQAVLMSVLNTLHVRGHNAIQWMRQLLLHQNPPIIA